MWGGGVCEWVLIWIADLTPEGIFYWSLKFYDDDELLFVTAQC